MRCMLTAPRRALRWWSFVALVGFVMSSIEPATSQAPVINEPPVAPIQILVFPQRDFVSASGYDATDQVIVDVIHPNTITFSTDPAHPVIPQADPRALPGAPFAGIVEVNHPGGACWFTTTPDIRPGDIVRIEIVGGPRAGRKDQTTVANVTAQRPVETAPNTIVVHGTAVAADGVSQIPIAQLEQRLVANKDLFDLNGRRTLRATNVAGSDGTLAYDSPTATTWTATYTGLSAADVTRALGSEARILWLGRTLQEGTVFEIGAAVIAGPAAPCTAPLEVLPPPPGSELIPPSTPTNLSAVVTQSNTVTLTWSPSTDNIGVTSYGIYREGLPIFNVQNLDGSAPAPTNYIDRNVPPGTYTYTVDAADAIGNRSGQSSGQTVTTVLQVATLPPGTVVNDPPVAPVQIISFPSRDFISSSGFEETDTVDVQVLRQVDGISGLVLVSSASGNIPQQDPRALPTDPFAGIVKVNHPGGSCWEGVTPDIRVGDIIRTIAYKPDGTIRTVDQTRTSNITVTRNGVEATNASSSTAADGIVKVHGVAMDAQGNPLPLDQFEQRMIANRDAFVFNGRRVLRAGGAGKDGTMTYDANDPTGTHWTATYSGLVQADIDRILGLNGFPGAEFRALWLGSVPLAGLELTIYENDPNLIVNGPTPPCVTLSEPFDTEAPKPPTLTAQQPNPTGQQNVILTWTGATDNVSIIGYGIYRDTTRIANVGPTMATFTDRNVPPGQHTYTVDAVDAASPNSGLPSGQNLTWGNRSSQAAVTQVIGSDGTSCVQGCANQPPPAGGFPVTSKDTTPPTVPTNLIATTNGNGGVNLTWSASTDDVGVVSYGVYRDTGKIADASGINYTDTVSTIGTYTYTVDAVDAAGNRSVQSATASATITAVADTSPPSVPTNARTTVSPDLITGKDIIVTWDASRDNVGVTGYNIYRNGSPTPIAAVNGTTLTYTDANLSAGTYQYTLQAFDSAGNHSGESAPSDATTGIIANDPPVPGHSLIAFPARDFISATGYPSSAGPYTFMLLRKNGAVYTSYISAPLNSDATGVVEVNHPGGTCWNLQTPDMRPGDVIRIVNAAGVAEQTRVAYVTAQRPIAGIANTVIIHGTAQDANGQPLPVAQVENRLIANKDSFDLNGRRTLRAGGAGTDGTLTYDTVNNPTGTNWTATYTNLSANDVARAVGGTSTTGTTFVGAESRAVWLGRDPVALTETTIFENGTGVVGGPTAPCTAPAETPVAAATFTPTSLDFGDRSATPSSASAPKTVTFSNGGGANMIITAVYLAGLNPGDFTITSAITLPVTLAPGASLPVSVTFSPQDIGTRQANLSFMDNAANTTDQSVPLTGNGIDPQAPSAPGAPAHSLAVGSGLTVLTPIENSTIPVTLTWTPSTTGALTGYQLQRSLNGGAFVDVTPSPGTTPNLTRDLAMGTTIAPNAYQFRVRGCNSTHCSAWVLGPKFNTMPIDESNTAFVSFNGTWTLQNIAGAYNGAVRFASTSKDKAQLPNKVTFTTTGSMAWITMMGPDRGRAVVAVDGNPAVNVDLYSPTVKVAVIGYTANLLAGGVRHNMVIQVLGAKNASSTGNRVDVDGFVLLE